MWRHLLSSTSQKHSPTCRSHDPRSPSKLGHIDTGLAVVTDIVLRTSAVNRVRAVVLSLEIVIIFGFERILELGCVFESVQNTASVGWRKTGFFKFVSFPIGLLIG